MLPAEAYTSPEVLAWERRHLFAGSWTCLGRVDDLLRRRRRPVTQRAVDGRRRLGAAGARRRTRCGCSPTPAGTAATSCCRTGESSQRRSDRVPLPRLDLRPRRVADRRPRVPRRRRASTPASTGWSSCRCEVWEGWVFGHALHPLGSAEVPSVRRAPRRRWRGSSRRTPRARWCVADRHTYEVAANWKVIAENYHECYHCPLIHPELCQVTPAGLRRQLRPAGRLGRRRRWTCATGWRRCR